MPRGQSKPADQPFDFARMSDDDLLARIEEQRQPEALGALYDRYAGTVMAVCIRILGDGSAAETIVEDVFYALWQKRHRKAAKTRSIVHTLTSRARQLAIELRRSRRSPSQVSTRCVDAPTTDAPSDDSIAAAEQYAQRSRVRAAMNKLPAAAREVLEMACLDGWSVDEIACRLHTDARSVRGLLRQGLSLFRDALANANRSDAPVEMSDAPNA